MNEPVGAAGSTTLTVERLSVRIARRQLVDDVSFAVDRGEWLTIVGANGAGKSTLLRAVAGLVAHRGEVRIGGRCTDALPARQRARHLAMVAQHPMLPPAMTVTSYVLLGRIAHMGRLARESAADLDAVARILQRLDAVDLAERRLGTLSGGEAQRVCIARALVQEAPLLLLDEPTSSLDIGHQLEVLELLDELRRAGTLSVVSTMHDLTMAGQYADRVLLLAEGRRVADGSAAIVLTEENIARHYGAEVRVLHDEHGLVVLPARPARHRD